MCDKCFKDSRTHIVCRENKSEIIFLNSDGLTVERVRIDGCRIKDNEIKKCDYLLLIDTKSKALFIELKGSKIGTAIEQLFETLNNKALQPMIEGYKKTAYAVVVKGTIVPRHDTKIGNARMRFEKNQCELKVVTSPHTCDLVTGIPAK